MVLGFRVLGFRFRGNTTGNVLVCREARESQGKENPKSFMLS